MFLAVENILKAKALGSGPLSDGKEPDMSGNHRPKYLRKAAKELGRQKNT